MRQNGYESAEINSRTKNYEDDFETCKTLVDTATATRRDEKAKRAMTEGINTQLEVVTLGARTETSNTERYPDSRSVRFHVALDSLELQAGDALDVFERVRDQGFVE
jgi:hypothetical protein